ncbi:MAG: cyclase family protein [Dehalococcoidia bacterium]|nr:cyclase family protein [Dehalococcoidia bacterium]
MSNWIDITVPIREDMPVYEGDPAVAIGRAAAIARGDRANVTELSFGAHTGTHVDAPVHFIEGAAGVEALSPAALMGPAVVVDATGVAGNIDGGALAGLAIPAGAERILFRTQNSRLWDLDRFSGDFIGLTGEAAAALVGRGVRLVGMDYLSVAPKADPAPAHETLLRAGVVILEGLDLRGVGAGWYELACLPLLIPGSDGGPCRALLRRVSG